MPPVPADYPPVAVSQPQTSRRARLRLITVGGRAVEARMVYHGDRFGPGGRNVYASYRPCVEITRVRTLTGRTYLNTFGGDLLCELLAPFPILPVTHDGSVRIPPQEVRRLVEWVEDPESARLPLPVTTLVAADGARGEAIAAELPEPEFAVSLAVDGDDALRLAGRRQPELVITEAGLPRLDGIQLVRELRRTDATSRAALLLVGAHADDEYALNAGANACLPWPLDASRLRLTVRELLGLA
jgi:CheY-like chemotaxis protein